MTYRRRYYAIQQLKKKRTFVKVLFSRLYYNGISFEIKNQNGIDALTIVSGSVVDGLLESSAVVDLAPLGLLFDKRAIVGNSDGLEEIWASAFSGSTYDPANPTHWTVSELHYNNLNGLLTSEYQDRIFPRLVYASDGTLQGMRELFVFSEEDGLSVTGNSALIKAVPVSIVRNYLKLSYDEGEGRWEYLRE